MNPSSFPATSKLHDFTNTESTSEGFGFWGEALASISRNHKKHYWEA
ncbi:hypothetical protein AALP_AA4G047500 [Arabis alpina]|uniref:Uncharacterized protein n=1 Tax=Arabis alpina TaxID=50452 RepID=A0A087H168_ARAAL|nr:hypothetical protein AALP_AA4G047500 [Arabis alpina]